MFRTRKEMQSLINSSRRSLAIAETKITERNQIIKDLMEENKKLKADLVDRDNNIMFLFNNLSAQKKKLARPDTSN